MTPANLRAWRRAWFIINNIEAKAALDIADRAALAKDVRSLVATRVHAIETQDAHRKAHVECLRASSSLNQEAYAQMELWDAVASYCEVLLDKLSEVTEIPTEEMRELFVRAKVSAMFDRRIVTAEHWNEVLWPIAEKRLADFRVIEGESWEAHVVKAGAS